MECQACQAPRGTGVQLGPQGSWGTEVSQGRMGSQGSRAHRALGGLPDFLGLQGSQADGGRPGRRERQGLEDPQECLVCGVTRGLVAWQGSRGSQVKGGCLGPMDLQDQLGPKVSQVSPAALEAQEWRAP